MAIQVRTAITGQLPALRYEPTAKRIRARRGGRTVADSTRAVLLWEPRRVVPSYAVPADDIAAELVLSAGAQVADDESLGVTFPGVSDRPVLDPSIPFAVHSAPGAPLDLQLDLQLGGERLPGAGFRLDEPDLPGYVVLDFAPFDWLEEDEPNVGHPRDPFHRIDILDSSRPVRIERDGVLLAESTRSRLLFETLLPTRIYLPREDVVAELTPTDTHTWCAYKGQASYWSAAGTDDIAWSYPEPLREAARIKDHVCFFNERIDLVLDGVRHERPVTPWS